MKKGTAKTAALLLCAAALFTSCGAGDSGKTKDYNQMFNQRWYNQSCASEDAIYFVSDYKLMFYDIASGITAPLCAKPECSHDTSDCNAYYNGSGLSMYDGKLYWVQQTSAGCDIVCENPDGTGRMTVRSVENGVAGEELFGAGGMNPETAFHRGNVFYALTVGDISQGEQTTFAAVTQTKLTGSDGAAVIYRNDDMSQISIKPHGDSVYMFALGKDNSTLEIYRHDIQSGEGEVLYSGACPIAEQSGNFRAVVFDDMIMLVSNAGVYQYEFANSSLNELYKLDTEADSYYPCGIADGYVICGRSSGSSYSVRTIDFDGGVISDTTISHPDIDENLIYFPIGIQGDTVYIVASMWSNATPYVVLFDVDARSGEYSVLWSNKDDVDTAN